MIKFDLRLNPETVEQIKQAADKDSRTVSAMARKILEDYFKYPNAYIPGKGGIIYGAELSNTDKISELLKSVSFKKDNTTLSEIFDFIAEKATAKVENGNLIVPVINVEPNKIKPL